MTARAALAAPSTRPIDGVFRALSDPTRRHVLERLSRSPASVSELAAPFDMALPSFVAALAGAGRMRTGALAQERPRRTYQLAPAAPAGSRRTGWPGSARSGSAGSISSTAISFELKEKRP